MTFRSLRLIPFALCLLHCGYPEFEFGPSKASATSTGVGGAGGASVTTTATSGGDATTTTSTTTTTTTSGVGGAGGAATTTTTTTTTTATTTSSSSGSPPQVVCQDGMVMCNVGLICCFHDSQASCDRCAQPGDCFLGAPASCFIGSYQEFACDDNGDCPVGQVCCFNDANPSSACAASCDANNDEYFLCDSGACPPPQGCFEINGHAGYDFCK